MTKTRAIKQATLMTTQDQTWNKKLRMWEYVTMPAGLNPVYWLRDRRAEAALSAMGYNDGTIYMYVVGYGPGTLTELVNAFIEDNTTIEVRNIEHVTFNGRATIFFDFFEKKNNAWIFRGVSQAPEGTAKKRLIDFIQA